MFRKQAEAIEEPKQLTLMQQAAEKVIETQLDKETREDAETQGHEDAIPERQDSVTKTSALRDIEFYDKVGSALHRTRVQRKLREFGK